MTKAVTVFAIEGIPRITKKVDLAELLTKHLADAKSPDGGRALIDGDVVVISSKLVAKAEGRVAPANQREAVIESETSRVVANRGETVIVRNRHGVVLAAAGVDESNTEADQIVLWPVDPDQSARELRKQLQARLGVSVGVVITDTLGRPWRVGLTDAAIGSSGVTVLADLRGQADAFGRELTLTEIALGDEIAAAADLVKAKSALCPVAIVRGLSHLVGDDLTKGGDHGVVSTGQNAATLIRPESEDLFTLGTFEARREGAINAVTQRRTVREFDQSPIVEEEFHQVLAGAVLAAITAPAPHHSAPWRFVYVEPATKEKLLAAMSKKWREDLAEIDGLSEEVIAVRLKRGEVLHRAPRLVVPCLVRDNQHRYPDPRRSRAEEDMFTMSAGAAIENFLVYLAASGWGGAWISSAIFCPDEVREALDLAGSWQPMGVIAIGKPSAEPTLRPEKDLADYLTVR